MAISTQDQFDQEILNLVNLERTQRGLNPLTLSNNLDQSADLHSQAMAEQDFYDHINPITGTDPGDRAIAQGFNPRALGENIAVGYISAQEVMAAWMNSPGHRDNILYADFTYLGVGYFELQNDRGNVNYNRYWTQVFGAGTNPGAYSPEMEPSSSGTPLIEGTSAGDVLVGTSLNEQIKGLAGNDTLKGAGGQDTLDGGTGNDKLLGGGGNDQLIGMQNNDVLRGGAGNDRLIGVNPNQSNALVGKNEKDRLNGNAGADVYVLGDNGKVYYDDGNVGNAGTKDYALIQGFRIGEGDRIQLEGRATDYVLGTGATNVPAGTQIYLKNPNGPNELIGVVQNVTLTNLNGSMFQYV